MKYLIDANTLIQPYNAYYGESIVPSYWVWLESDPEVFIIENVREEIKKKIDNIAELIKNLKTFSVPEDKFTVVADYVSKHYSKDNEKASFLNKADPWLVATGIGRKDITIVTFEVAVDDSSTKIKIPNVCKNFEVPYTNIFDVLKKKQINLSNYSKPN